MTGGTASSKDQTQLNLLVKLSLRALHRKQALQEEYGSLNSHLTLNSKIARLAHEAERQDIA